MQSSPDMIKKHISEMKASARELTKSIYHICAYMRNVSREEAWSLTLQEREIINKIIKDKINTMDKTKGQLNLL